MVYLVQCSSGTYDDYFTWIDSAWDIEGDANLRIAEIKKKRDKMLSEECPVDENIPYNDLTEDQMDAIMDWQTTGNDARGLHDPVKIKMQMNVKGLLS